MSQFMKDGLPDDDYIPTKKKTCETCSGNGCFYCDFNGFYLVSDE